MTFKEFLKSKLFRNNALAALGINIALILLSMLFLRFYTNHGDSVEIPDLKGKTSREVTILLDRLDLQFQIRDSVFSPGAVPGTVVDQFPKSGMKVKGERTVLITLSTVNQENIPMPQLTDISYRQAVNLMQRVGLIPGTIEYKMSEFPNLVLEQKIRGQKIRVGQKVPKGSVVNLVLGSDSDGLMIEVPTLFGRSLAEAQLTLGEAFLSIGTVNYDESIVNEDDKAISLIFKQNPDPSEIFEIAKGSSIDIWLTIDPKKLEAKPELAQPENSFF
jgi:hypothetical protein